MAESAGASLGALFDKKWDADKAKWQELEQSGRLERHCSKHVVVRDVPDSEFNAVVGALDYVLGSRSYWNTSARKVNGVKVYDLEAVYQAGDRRCSKPWEWCGTTVLFADWQESEARRRDAVRTYRIGQPVSFEHKGRLKRGLVAAINDKTVGVIVEGEGRWRVSPNLLTAE